MNKLPIYFGYAGILPFLIFSLIIIFANNEQSDETAFALIQVAYGAMILSFLGGVHWGQALPSNHKKQLSFSMLPTIIGLIMLVLTILGYGVVGLIGTALMFIITYEADKKLMPIDYIPPGYFVFRRNLTYIVAGLLTVSALTLN